MGDDLILKVFSLLLIAFGIALVINPELVSNKPIPEDTYQAIERRIWWGLLIGVGILFLFHHQLHPWLPTVVAAGTSITFGLLAARLIGIALDGSVARQWVWVAVEGVILIGLVWWYAKIRS